MNLNCSSIIFKLLQTLTVPIFSVPILFFGGCVADGGYIDESNGNSEIGKSIPIKLDQKCKYITSLYESNFPLSSEVQKKFDDFSKVVLNLLLKNEKKLNEGQTAIKNEFEKEGGTLVPDDNSSKIIGFSLPHKGASHQPIKFEASAVDTGVIIIDLDRDEFYQEIGLFIDVHFNNEAEILNRDRSGPLCKADEKDGNVIYTRTPNKEHWFKRAGNGQFNCQSLETLADHGYDCIEEKID